MFPRHFRVIAAVLVACGPAVAAQPATRPVVRITTTSTSVSSLVKSARTALAAATPGGTYALSEVLRASYQQGTLNIEIPEAVRQPGRWRLEIKGSDADWLINSSGPQAAGFGQMRRYSSVTRYDFDEAEKQGLWNTRVSVTDHGMSLYGQFGAASAMQSMTLSVQANGVRLVLTERGRRAGQPNLALTAGDLMELRGRHSEEFRRFVKPALRAMLGADPLAVRAADAYRAFAEVPADPEMMRRLRGVLERFESPDATERENAGGQLAALGPGGVLAALRMDREGLMPEQRSRLNDFVGAYDDGRFGGAASLKDVSFLIDCLEFEDVRVRRAARDRLAGVLGREVDFDVEVDAEARAAAADRLREEQAKAAATRPATGPAGVVRP